MHYRELGRTGISVSEIGYGAWGIGGTGWIGAQDDESKRALNRAIDLGLTFIDTAWEYGDGHSERVIGEVLRGRDEQVYVATKVPPKNRMWPARHDSHADEAFPGGYIREYTEESLRNLGVETLDIQQFHVWSSTWLEQGDWLDEVRRLKQDGKIRFFGVSINDHEPASAVPLVRSGAVDTVDVPRRGLAAPVLSRRPQAGSGRAGPGHRRRPGRADRAAAGDRAALRAEPPGGVHRDPRDAQRA